MSGHLDEPAEEIDLDLSRRVIVVKVEAGLPDSDNFGIPGKGLHSLERLLVHFFDIMGVHADGGIEPRVRIGKRQSRVVARKIAGATHDNDSLYPHCPGLLDHLGDIGCKLWPLNVSVAINQTHADFGYHLTFAG